MVSRRKKLGDVRSDQWVLIAPETLKEDAKQPSGKTLLAKLRSPLTDKGAMFLFINSGQQLCEVKAFNEEFRSWFVGQTVQQDGRLLYATPVDPLFLVIYYLLKADKEQGKFQPVEQIVVDEEFPSCNMLLKCTKVEKSLCHVTEEKEIGRKKFYKYSKEKTLAWLKKKIDQTVQVLKSSDVCVGGGVQSASFIRNKQGSDVKEVKPDGNGIYLVLWHIGDFCAKCIQGTEDYIRYAHGLVSEYIPGDLRIELSHYLNLPDVSSPTPEPPTKKRKVSDKPVEAEEDYTKYNSNSLKKTNSKMTAAQKSLAKVDKSGMKNISSFFSPKGKAAK